MTFIYSISVFSISTHILFIFSFIDELYWSCPNVGGYIPNARSDFAFSSNRNDMLSEILILGGKTQNNKDTFLYILSELGQKNINKQKNNFL